MRILALILLCASAYATPLAMTGQSPRLPNTARIEARIAECEEFAALSFNFANWNFRNANLWPYTSKEFRRCVRIGNAALTQAIKWWDRSEQWQRRLDAIT